MEPAKILVIEDDAIVARTIERTLRGSAFTVTVKNSGADGLKAALSNIPDLVILDILMPGMDGYAVCREMRSDPRLDLIPILFLTAKIKDEDKINGFQAGGDDYLCKPFNIDELILRVTAILRRTRVLPPAKGKPAAVKSPASSTQDPTRPASQVMRTSASGSTSGSAGKASNGVRIQIGEFVLDTRSYELETPTRGKVRLTPVQFDLLYHLMGHPGEIFSPARLLDEIWDYPTDRGSPDLVRVHIKTLRARIERDPRAPAFIRTVSGYGYTVDPIQAQG